MGSYLLHKIFLLCPTFTYSFYSMFISEHWKINSTGLDRPIGILTGINQCVSVLLRKEVIQPHLPIRLPCYDFTPIIEPTFDCCLLTVSSQASGVTDSHGVTGGVYKARERIHRDILIRDY